MVPKLLLTSINASNDNDNDKNLIKQKILSQFLPGGKCYLQNEETTDHIFNNLKKIKFAQGLIFIEERKIWMNFTKYRNR